MKFLIYFFLPGDFSNSFNSFSATLNLNLSFASTTKIIALFLNFIFFFIFKIN